MRCLFRTVMHFRFLNVFAVTAVLALASGCAGVDDPARVDLRIQTRTIVGGQPEAGHLAVGALVTDGEYFCTGTLVTSDVIVTAAHCLEGFSRASELSMFFGTNANNLSSGTLVSVSAMLAHPDYDDYNVVNDIAVLRLAESPSITPIGLMEQPLTDAYIGRDALFVGFGARDLETGADGERYSVSIPITEVDPTTFTYAHPSRSTCFGDSGGPALLQVDGLERLIGVTSWGDEYCEEFGVNTRVDAYVGWIQDFVEGRETDPTDPTDPDPDPEPNPDGDFCEDYGWYGDGICDVDCPRPDPDCDDEPGDDDPDDPDDSDGDICEEYGWYGDGICDVDCPRPDPDCDGSSDDPYGDDPYGDDSQWDSDDEADDEDADSREPGPAERPGETIDTHDETSDDSGGSGSGGCSMTGGAAGAGWFVTMFPVAFALWPRRRRSE